MSRPYDLEGWHNQSDFNLDVDFLRINGQDRWIFKMLPMQRRANQALPAWANHSCSLHKDQTRDSRADSAGTEQLKQEAWFNLGEFYWICGAFIHLKAISKLLWCFQCSALWPQRQLRLFQTEFFCFYKKITDDKAGVSHLTVRWIQLLCWSVTGLPTNIPPVFRWVSRMKLNSSYS